jgi:hypothetical protein
MPTPRLAKVKWGFLISTVNIATGDRYPEYKKEQINSHF